MPLSVAHRILVCSASVEEALAHVRRFFNESQLLTYAELYISPEESLNGKDAAFWPEIDHGLAANRAFTQEMATLLKQEGYQELSTLLNLEPGYLTKMLHILCHMLDGFIGVDSAFYNLVEDSHSLSAGLRDKIMSQARSYWLVIVRADKVRASSILPSRQHS